MKNETTTKPTGKRYAGTSSSAFKQKCNSVALLEINTSFLIKSC
jgi:hypothetical protein